MESIATIADFLTAGDTNWRVFELGRRVQPIANEQFAAIERGEQPWPYARQQQAWLGIVFWHKEQRAQHYVWFLKLPLDERSLFQHAARQHFLSIVTEALGQEPTRDPSEDQARLMEQNPYLWQPDEHRRGAFHAQVSRLLELPPSVYFAEAESFCRGGNSAHWQNLGLQGLHDVASRSLGQPAVQQHLPKLLTNGPENAQQILAETLEHHELPAVFSRNLLAQVPRQAQPEQQLRLLRACASNAANPEFTQRSRQLLQELSGTAQSELLLILAARCWPVLTDQQLLHAYLEQLAAQGQELFIQVFRDLVMLPQLRTQLLTTLQQPGSDRVRQALQGLIAATRGGS